MNSHNDSLKSVPVFDGVWSDERDVGNAITDAANAAITWSKVPLNEREAVLRRFAAHVAANAESLTLLIMREVGKLRADAATEVAAVVAKAEITIEMMRGRRGDLDSTTRDVVSQVRYRALGVVVVLGPFNFPAHLPGGQIAPALLAGNAVVFKPSELAPAVGKWIADAWTHAELPTNVLQLIQGDASIAKVAIADDRIAGVFFTGSHRAGVAIHRQLAGRPDVLLTLEMGGNNPVVLMPPYELAKAATTIATSAFISSGQRCTCARRLIVVDDGNGDEVVSALIELVREMKCGLPSDDPAADMGPVISAMAAENLIQTQSRWIDCGGVPLLKMLVSPRAAALVTPGIIEMTGCESVEDEEWFGPLLQVFRVTDFQAAIRLANATKYGLAAGLIGGTQESFEEFRSSIAAGIVNWNLPTTGASSRLPFGGIGLSGNHRAVGSYAIDCCNDPIASMMSPWIALRQ